MDMASIRPAPYPHRETVIRLRRCSEPFVPVNGEALSLPFFYNIFNLLGLKLAPMGYSPPERPVRAEPTTLHSAPPLRGREIGALARAGQRLMPGPSRLRAR
jgi:hypothetical protein